MKHLALALVIGFSSSFARAEAPSPDLARLHAKLADKSKWLTWVITGDSITHGAKWLGKERSYPEILMERIRWELHRTNDVWINTGVSGDTTQGVLAHFEWRVTRFHPDVVSIMFGMNDAKQGPAGREPFRRNLIAMARKVRAGGAILIINRTNTTDVSDPGLASQRLDLPAYNQIIADVAASEHAIEMDHWTHWQQAKPTIPALRAWLGESIHPNAAGHRQMAIVFCQALGIYDPAAPSCQP